MIKVTEKLELVVPVKEGLRQDIRHQIDEYFSRNEYIAPVSYQQLKGLSDFLIESNKWPSALHAFVMVCCGNAIWRKVVGAVPFNRRILLLPQCLRNSQSCKAKFDQFGLLCESCKQCSISDYIDEAENLGYVVLVTEGTSATARLIESGKIDAVIGVGCMEVLQKIFSSIEKYAVPGIGIPLLGNGCKDTVADRKWIREELHHIQSNTNIHLLNTSQINSDVQSIFEKEKLKDLLGSSNDETEEIAIKSMLLGGNRYRAFLSALTYIAFSDAPSKESIERVALSVECFHKASLIHDDIEDNDFSRYGKDTVHAEYGVPVAINVGDLLIGEGYRLIAESAFAPEIIVKCFQLLSSNHKSMSLGQGTELLSMLKNNILTIDELIHVFEQKTASAFRVSLLLGAIAAGADQKSIEILDHFSRNIGIAYQMMDDIDDYNSHFGDIEKHKISALVSLLFSNLAEQERENLKMSLKLNDFEGVYKQIEKASIKEKAIQLLKEYIQKSKESIEELKNAGLKIALHSILGKMFSEYF
jgi:geranylgeranyl diphosphate synthase, type II